MKYLVFIALFSVGLIACTKKGQADQKLKEVDSSTIDKEHPAKMTFKDTIYDFGTIAHGEVITHEFEFTNTGESPLIIVDAKSSCGCTIPSWPKEAIMPGESGSIKVKFDSNNKKGLDINKTVNIAANTYPNTTNSVYITGKVAGHD